MIDSFMEYLRKTYPDDVTIRAFYNDLVGGQLNHIQWVQNFCKEKDLQFETILNAYNGDGDIGPDPELENLLSNYELLQHLKAITGKDNTFHCQC